jgi:4-alpha-glucanotransferase
MRDTGYESFAAVLRANLRFAGALRIDHVMGLDRLFWIPPGGTGDDGAYVRYPLDDLLAVLALESTRARCLVVGEDLGTVPEGFRDRMAQEGILSTRLFYFERHEDGLYKRPAGYPARSMVQATTHDLPTLAGFWEGRDIAVRSGIDPGYDAAAARLQRERDCRLMLAALRDQGLLEHDVDESAPLVRIVAAIHRFLARTPAGLMLANLDDVMLAEDQLNLPGTVEEHANWSRRLPHDLAALTDLPVWRELMRAIADEGRATPDLRA